MAYKQINNPISRKTSPLHTHKPGHFPGLEKKFEGMEEEMKKNAMILTNRADSSDDEQTYAGGEVGADYNEEGFEVPDSTSVKLTKTIKKKKKKKVLTGGPR